MSIFTPIPVHSYRPKRQRRKLRWREKSIIEAFQKLYYNSWKKKRSTSPDTINIHWFGAQTLKCPMDLWTYQEMLVELQPDWVIETGTCFGGSAYFIASIMDLLGKGQVITIDIEENETRPSHPRIEYVTASSTSPETIEYIKNQIGGSTNNMVILDSDHKRDHVRQEIQLYRQFVPVGGYLVVEDTNVNGNPVNKKHGPGPMEAVQSYLGENDDFEIDLSRERFLMTLNPNGFLKRIRQP